MFLGERSFKHIHLIRFSLLLQPQLHSGLRKHFFHFSPQIRFADSREERKPKILSLVSAHNKDPFDRGYLRHSGDGRHVALEAARIGETRVQPVTERDVNAVLIAQRDLLGMPSEADDLQERVNRHGRMAAVPGRFAVVVHLSLLLILKQKFERNHFPASVSVDRPAYK